MRPLMIALTLLLLHATAALAAPCDPPPAALASVVFTSTPSQMQSAFQNGGVLRYNATVRNDSAERQRLGVQVFLEADGPGLAQADTLYMQSELTPSLAPGASKTFERTLTIPPGLRSLCLLVNVHNYNPQCGNADLRAFTQLASTKACSTPEPVSCVASSACGPYSICWDHTPTLAEVLTWTDAHCR